LPECTLPLIVNKIAVVYSCSFFCSAKRLKQCFPTLFDLLPQNRTPKLGPYPSLFNHARTTIFLQKCPLISVAPQLKEVKMTNDKLGPMIIK